MATYRFNVGDITCIAIQEGEAPLDLNNLNKRYPNATEDDLAHAVEVLGLTEENAKSYYNALYIHTGDTQILVDTGMGQHPDRPQFGQIIPNLASEGIQPEDIDIVFITHFHGDHYLGLLTDGAPTYPNAEVITSDIEWDFWMSDEAAEKMGDRIKGIKAIFEPLSDKVRTVSAGDAIAEGVTVVSIAGHTMGQSGLMIESGDDSLFHLVDILHHEAQFLYPDWQFVWDTDGELGVKTRRAQLGNAVNRNLQVMFYHLPFPGIGTVSRDGDHYQWHPITQDADHSVTEQGFKDAMATWASGVTVITTELDGQFKGTTASSFSSVSLNPPLVLVCLAKKLYTHEVVDKAGKFAVNILGDDQQFIGEMFAGMHPEIENRFDEVKTITAETGCPILEEASAWVDCVIKSRHDEGDHTIFVGEVKATNTNGHNPLLYYNRNWGTFEKK